MAAQEDGRPASWLRAVHLCPARVLVFPSRLAPGVRASPRNTAASALESSTYFAFPVMEVLTKFQSSIHPRRESELGWAMRQQEAPNHRLEMRARGTTRHPAC